MVQSRVGIRIAFAQGMSAPRQPTALGLLIFGSGIVALVGTAIAVGDFPTGGPVDVAPEPRAIRAGQGADAELDTDDADFDAEQSGEAVEPIEAEQSGDAEPSGEADETADLGESVDPEQVVEDDEPTEVAQTPTDDEAEESASPEAQSDESFVLEEAPTTELVPLTPEEQALLEQAYAEIDAAEEELPPEAEITEEEILTDELDPRYGYTLGEAEAVLGTPYIVIIQQNVFPFAPVSSTPTRGVTTPSNGTAGPVTFPPTRVTPLPSPLMPPGVSPPGTPVIPPGVPPANVTPVADGVPPANIPPVADGVPPANIPPPSGPNIPAPPAASPPATPAPPTPSPPTVSQPRIVRP